MISSILSKRFAWWIPRVWPRALMLDDITEFTQGLYLMRSSSLAKRFDARWYHWIYPGAILDEIIEFSQALWCLMKSWSLAKSFDAWWYHWFYPRALLDEIIECSQELWCWMISSSIWILSWDHGINLVMRPWHPPTGCTVGRVQVPSSDWRWHVPRCANVGAWGKTCAETRALCMARAFPLGPTAIQNGKIGEASYMFYALESIFFMFCWSVFLTSFVLM